MNRDNFFTYSNESNYENIYIVLTQTKTYPARAIRLYTQEPYAHASIAFDENLEEMYSFARRGVYNPFNAGFIREDIDKGYLVDIGLLHAVYIDLKLPKNNVKD